MFRFSAEIFKIGVNPVVETPKEILDLIFEQAGRSKGPIPVRGRLNGAPFIQTLVRFQGEWRLYLNGPMLRSAKLAVGDTANIEVGYDPEPRAVPMPEMFGLRLEIDGAAKAEFESLSPSRQKEILRYLGNLKTAEAIERNVETIIRQLAGKPVDKPHVAIRPGGNRNLR